MARITITLDIDVDPTLVDPHDAAHELVDLYDEDKRHRTHPEEAMEIEFVGAEWSDS